MNFLTGLLASIIRPIIQEEIQNLKIWIGAEIKKAIGVKVVSKEAKALQEELKNATSDAERKVILGKIADFTYDIEDRLGGL